MKTYYVGMDVHQASIAMVVLNGAGKSIMQLVIQTKAEAVREFFKGLKGKVRVTLEEGTQATWLYDLLRPLVSEVIVCDPRRNKYLSAGNKGDRVDALKLAQLLRSGLLRPVYHGERGLRALKELVRNYNCLVADTTRVMNRLKAIFRGRGIGCAGSDVYRPDRREQWLGKLKERGVKQRADFLYQQLEALQPLRQEAKLAMLKEARRHAAYQWLASIPQLGCVRVAQIMAVIETPHRFRSKRQFWTYLGLAVVTRTSAEHEVVKGSLRKRSRPPATRGLNRNFNRLMKKVFKSAASSACVEGPFQPAYQQRVAGHMDESLARLVVARKLAATTLTIWKRGERFKPERMTPPMA
jgi:transposase